MDRVVKLSIDGKNHVEVKNGVLHMYLGEREYDEYMKSAKAEKDRQNEIDRKKELQIQENMKKAIRYNEQTERMLQRVNQNAKGTISNLAKEANTLPTEKYKKRIKEKEKMKTKRKVSGPKIFKKTIKYTVVTVMIGGLVFGGIKGAKDYKKEAYNNALNSVKENIALSIENTSPEEINIYDNSSNLNESTYKEEYIVEIGEEKYVYREVTGNGNREVERDEIKNSEVNAAIQIVGNAQNGDILEAKRANKLVQKIENGEIDLSMKNAVKARQKVNKSMEEDFIK